MSSPPQGPAYLAGIGGDKPVRAYDMDGVPSAGSCLLVQRRQAFLDRDQHNRDQREPDTCPLPDTYIFLENCPPQKHGHGRVE